MILWRICVAGNNKTCLGLQVQCPIFLSDCNRIWTLSTDSHKGPQYQISWKCVSGSRGGTSGHTGRQTDGHDEATYVIGAFCDYANTL